jgi:hypothetical protein
MRMIPGLSHLSGRLDKTKLAPSHVQRSQRGSRSNRSSSDMTSGPTKSELEERIAIIRQNIADLVEQAAAYSGAADEARAADRLAEQEQELAKLIALRDAALGK